YCPMPVIIRGNQRSRDIVQLQGGIRHCIGNAMLNELRTYRSNNYPLCLGSLNNESSDHHIVASLHKGAGGDVTKPRWNNGRRRRRRRRRGNSIKLKCTNVRNSQTAIPALILGWRSRITAVDGRAAGVKSIS